MSTVVTRYGMENVLKIGYPCSCHISPFESETYTVMFLKRDPISDTRITHIIASCNICKSQKTFEIKDRWLTDYDVKDLI